MTVTKRRFAGAYNKAVYAELQRRGQTPKQALRTFHRYYRPLRKTWGLELNPEAFADEMLKLQKMAAIDSSSDNNNTITISMKYPSNFNQTVTVPSPLVTIKPFVGRPFRGTRGLRNKLVNSKLQLKLDPTGKVIIERARHR
jgi:hypothetical protein